MSTGYKHPEEFRKRIVTQCSLIGIDITDISALPRLIAIEWISRDIAPYDPEIDSYSKVIDKYRGQIRRDLKNGLPRTGERVIWYCNLFNCSADFIMGFSDTPNYEQKNIKELTGLSDPVCRTLLKKDGMVMPTLNELIPDIDVVEQYFRSFDDYGFQKYQVPGGEMEHEKLLLLDYISLYLTEQKVKTITDGFSTIEVNEKDTIFINGILGVPLMPEQLSAITMLSIQESLQKIKQYKALLPSPNDEKQQV